MTLNTPAYRIPSTSALFDRNLFNRIVLLISALVGAFRRLFNYLFRLRGLARPLGLYDRRMNTNAVYSCLRRQPTV